MERRMDNMIKKFRLGELFCGPGGLALGAIQASISDPDYRIVHEWANDYDLDTCNTYRRNICPNDRESVVHGDVRELDIDSLGEIDAFAFGFPCNDFSVVGEQKGFAGNYPNLYKFEEYGVPQARHRMIIVGIREDLPYEYKVPSTEKYRNVDVACKTAIEVPPIPKDAANNEFTKQSATVIERLKHIKPGQNAFTADLPEELRLNVRGAKISQIYKRLDPTKPAYTVTGSGGGGTHIYHYKENRALTNRERARLQTFPDNFVFEGSKESIRKQIGMAVPAKGAQVIFEAILNTFAGIEYDSMPASEKE